MKASNCSLSSSVRGLGLKSNAASLSMCLHHMAMTTEAGKPYLAVCAIFRWEEDYLREWVAFHRLMGVQRFFLYDNSGGDSHLEALQPFIDDGSVVRHRWDVHPGQGAAYDHCLENHGAEARWLAFIDCDEFLFSPTGRP